MNDMRKIVAVDFDGTVVQHAYPEIGSELPHATRVLRRLQSYYDLILHTCREDLSHGSFLTEAVEWCKERGVYFVGVNANAPHHEFAAGLQMNQRKVFAHHYLDDRSFPPFPGWLAVEHHLIEKVY